MKLAVNLSNGLAWAEALERPDAFVRIQSTWCEQKLWSDVLDTLDSTVLYWLARGERVVVHDATVRSGRPSRAVWQGLAVVRANCRAAWELDPAQEFSYSGCDMSGYMEEVWRELSPRTRRRLAYFGKFKAADVVDVLLTGRSMLGVSGVDGELERQRELASAMGT